MMAIGLGIGLGACTPLPNIAIKDLEKLRAAQTTCLIKNVHQMDDRASDPERIAREVATACNDTTERLATYAIPKSNPDERRKFEEEAEMRAAGYVKLARSGSI